MTLNPVEKGLLALCISLAAVDAILAAWKGISVDLSGYGLMLSIGLVLLMAGQFYRNIRKDERIALAATAMGLLVLFSNVGSAFNYLLLPRDGTPIDRLLIEVDAALGYSWPAFTAWVAKSPFLTELLRTVYLFYLPQLILVALFLGFMLDRERLNLLLVAATSAALLAILSWALFPSSGASAVATLSDEVDRVVRPVVGVEYGRELYRLLEEGVSFISPQNTLGLIGFPSYHTVGALLCAYVLLPYRALRVPAIAVNALMIPAILVHGGHNLLDVLGGLALGLVAIALSGPVIGALHRYDRRTDRPADRLGARTTSPQPSAGPAD